MFCASFYINPLKFLLSISTSLLLCSKQVQRNCLHFFNKIIKKIVHALRVNETKVTSRKDFSEKRDQKMTKGLSLESPLSIFLHQKVRKNPKMTKRPTLYTAPAFFTCLLTYSPQMPRICDFPDCFSFSRLLDTSCGFYNLKLSFTKSILIFT